MCTIGARVGGRLMKGFPVIAGISCLPLSDQPDLWKQREFTFDSWVEHLSQNDYNIHWFWTEKCLKDPTWYIFEKMGKKTFLRNPSVKGVPPSVYGFPHTPHQKKNLYGLGGYLPSPPRRIGREAPIYISAFLECPLGCGFPFIHKV